MAFPRKEKTEGDEKASSKIRLESYVVGTADKILHGLPRLSAGGKFNIEVDSVELAPGLVPPQNVLIMLYGFRDAADMLRAAKDSWQKYEGADFRPVGFDFEVGKIAPYIIPLKDEKTPEDKKDPVHYGIGAMIEKKKKITEAEKDITYPETDKTDDKPELVPVHRFLNVMRCKKEIQDHISSMFNAYGLESGEDLIEARIQSIATRPHHWARLLEEDELFSGVEIIVVPIATMKTQGEQKLLETRQFALVTKNAKLLSVEQNPKPLIQAVAPTWLTGEKPRTLPIRKMPALKKGVE